MAYYDYDYPDDFEIEFVGGQRPWPTPPWRPNCCQNNRPGSCGCNQNSCQNNRPGSCGCNQNSCQNNRPGSCGCNQNSCQNNRPGSCGCNQNSCQNNRPGSCGCNQNSCQSNCCWRPERPPINVPDFPVFPPISPRQYGYFVQYGTLTAAANGPISFGNTIYSTDKITNTQTGISILCPGIYYADYTILVPAGTTLNGSVALQVNNVPVQSSRSYIDVTNSATSTTYSGQAVFSVSNNTIVTLASTVPLNFTSLNSNEVMASLYLTQIQ